MPESSPTKYSLHFLIKHLFGCSKPLFPRFLFKLIRSSFPVLFVCFPVFLWRNCLWSLQLQHFLTITYKGFYGPCECGIFLIHRPPSSPGILKLSYQYECQRGLYLKLKTIVIKYFEDMKVFFRIAQHTITFQYFWVPLISFILWQTFTFNLEGEIYS